MSGIQFRLHATQDQLQALEQMCLMTESLMAGTLAKRIEGLSEEESLPFILDWFKSVRHMAHGAWIQSGIKTEVAPIGVNFPEGNGDAAREEVKKKERMSSVVAALDQMGIKLVGPQLEALWNALK